MTPRPPSRPPSLTTCPAAALTAATLTAVSLTAAVLLAAGSADPAAAHDWYPRACCSDKDCHPVAETAVKMTPAGWLVRTTGETIPFERARSSPDGRFHICSYGGLPDGKTICLFTPGLGS